MKRLCVFILLTGSLLNVYCQETYKKVLSSIVYEFMVQVSNNEMFLVGRDNYSLQFAMISINTGGIIWTNTFSGSEWRARDVIKSQDDNIIIIGYNNNANDYFNFLLKVDLNGDTLWIKKFYNIGLLSSILQTSDGGFAITGGEFINPLNYTILTKLDKNLNIEWSTYLANLNAAQGICQTNDSGFLVGASKKNTRFAIAKTNNIGDSLWVKTYDTTLQLSDIFQFSDSSFLLTGSTTGNVNSGTVCILMVDEMGNQLWRQTDSAIYRGYAIINNSFNEVVCAGWSISPGGNVYNSTISLWKLGNEGTSIWIRNYPQSQPGEQEYPVAITSISDGGYFILAHQIIYDYLPPIPVASNTLIIKTDDKGFLSDNVNLSEPINIYISPNPFCTQAKIEIKNFTPGQTEFYLFDLFGREVYRTVITSSPYTLHRPTLPDGMYLWKAVRSEGVGAGKLVLE